MIWIWLQKTLACWGSGCCVTVAGAREGGREIFNKKVAWPFQWKRRQSLLPPCPFASNQPGSSCSRCLGNYAQKEREKISANIINQDNGELIWAISVLLAHKQTTSNDKGHTCRTLCHQSGVDTKNRPSIIYHCSAWAETLGDAGEDGLTPGWLARSSKGWGKYRKKRPHNGVTGRDNSGATVNFKRRRRRRSMQSCPNSQKEHWIVAW